MVDEPPFLQEVKHTAHRANVADKASPGLGEREPARWSCPEPLDEGVAVVLVGFRAPGPRHGRDLPFEELRQQAALRVADAVVREPPYVARDGDDVR